MEAIRRILCAVDLSDASAHAAAQAVALAGWNRACFTALHVAEPVFAPFPGLPAVDERVSFEERRHLGDRVAEYFRDAGGVAVDVVFAGGRPAHVILDRADQLLADVIVMATPGARGFERLALGSVT